MTLEEKAKSIIRDIKEEKGNNPIRIFKNIASKEYVNIHGPEHHILDGASILVAYNCFANILTSIGFIFFLSIVTLFPVIILLRVPTF